MKTRKQTVLEKEKQFQQIISDYNDRILNICRYYNSNDEDRKDMYQEILANIWKSLDSFRGDSSIGTWVYRVAVNTSLSYTGQSFKKMKLEVNKDMHNLNLVYEEDLLLDKLNEEARFNHLQNELNLLSVIDKALISLMLEGLSMKEISDVIGITEPNVKVKIHRIKSQLRTKLSVVKYENE